MFLLNEMVENIENQLLNIDEMVFPTFSYTGDYKPFEKGDLVYFDDFELVKLFKFFQILFHKEKDYDNFVDKTKIFKLYKPIFDYVNCIGKVKKVKTKNISFRKGELKRKKYIIEIEFPNGKSLIFNNTKYLKKII